MSYNETFYNFCNVGHILCNYMQKTEVIQIVLVNPYT